MGRRAAVPDRDPCRCLLQASPVGYDLPPRDRRLSDRLHADLGNGGFTGRFEYAHVSAHLADGYDGYDGYGGPDPADRADKADKTHQAMRAITYSRSISRCTAPTSGRSRRGPPSGPRSGLPASTEPALVEPRHPRSAKVAGPGRRRTGLPTPHGRRRGGPRLPGLRRAAVPGR